MATMEYVIYSVYLNYHLIHTTQVQSVFFNNLIFYLDSSKIDFAIEKPNEPTNVKHICNNTEFVPN